MFNFVGRLVVRLHRGNSGTRIIAGLNPELSAHAEAARWPNRSTVRMRAAAFAPKRSLFRKLDLRGGLEPAAS